MFFHQVALMLALHVYAPAHIILELLFLICRRIQQYLYRFGISDALKFIVQYKFQFFYQPKLATLVHWFLFFFISQALRQEFQVFPVMLQCITDDIFQQVLREVHIVKYVIKSHLRFYHPELRQVPCSIRILRPESWPECIHLAERHRTQFSFQLPAHG